MPLSSQGCNATIWEVFSITPNYQKVKLSTWKKNPPTAEKEYSTDFIEIAYLRGNRIQVKQNDTIFIKDFYLQNRYDNIKRQKVYYLNITSWDLKDKNDYSKIGDIEYKGSDYEDDE